MDGTLKQQDEDKMSNSQIVKRYTTNKICCLATNTVKTDRKIKYGSADALCCVAKDFRAQTFLKMMQCSSEVSGTTWYHIVLELEYSSKTPPAYDFISDLIITSGSSFIKSYDDTQSTTPLSFKGNYGVLANINEVTNAFAKKLDDWGKSQTTNTFFAFAKAVSNIISVDIYYDSTWGDNDGKPLSGDSIDGGANVPFDNQSTLISNVKDDTITSSACFTEVQLCAMKRVLDNYCKSCN
jgi:hypothetical protein